MTSEEVVEIVRSKIGDAWDESNLHGCDLRTGLVKRPCGTEFDINLLGGVRRRGRLWIVFEQAPRQPTGYKIVFDDNSRMFGLATPGHAGELPVCISMYNSFFDAFHAM